MRLYNILREEERIRIKLKRLNLTSSRKRKTRDTCPLCPLFVAHVEEKIR